MLRENHVKTRSPAKINLGLSVLEKRGDGFHEIETGMVAISWFDDLDFYADDKLTLTCSDPRLPTDDNNLCLRAGKLLQRTFPVSAGARIVLQKNIPFGAGLGGGSSNAAATLLALANLWQLDASRELLYNLAAQLGSDVPFFVKNEPAVAQGRGERLTPLLPHHPSIEALFAYTVLVVVPDRSVSTREAYRSIKPKPHPRPGIKRIIEEAAIEDWKDVLVNDFEKPLRDAIPEIESIKRKLYQAGASFASLSGSGSAMFGLFRERSDAMRAQQDLQHSNVTIELTHPLAGRSLDRVQF